ncbi:MAG: hypothetical protein WCJ19_03705 [bacterium]
MFCVTEEALFTQGLSHESVLAFEADTKEAKCGACALLRQISQQNLLPRIEFNNIANIFTDHKPADSPKRNPCKKCKSRLI